MAEKYQITKSRLLYVYGFPNPDKEHKKFKGLLKIGEVLVDNEDAQKDEQALKQLVRDMLSGRKYITEHEGYEIIFVECTTLINSTGCYKAQQVHDCLTNSGVVSERLSGRGKTEDIWFKTNLTEVEKAIKAVKEGEKSFNGADVEQKEISFRPEQKAAIDATVKRFKTKTGTRFLWNAKMRFGKTLSALQVVKEMKYERTLILTHRPVVDEGWYEDFKKIFFNDNSYHYGSKTKGEPFDKLEKLHDTKGDSYVYFASMQDLRGSELVGGKLDKNNEIFDIAWDCVIVDEAHEGTQTGLGKSVMAALEKEDTRVLRLSGTPFNLLDSFNQDEIYTWDYVMEQKAKLKWDDEHYGDPNPYADLPKMQICTFTTNKLVTEEVGEGKFFSFHEFFRTWTGDEKKDGKKMPDDKKEGDFVHYEAVKEFVERLRTPSDDNKYPFSTLEFQQNFRHTFWVVPRVAEADALEKVLKEDAVFGSKDNEGEPWFTIVNVAGEGEDKDGKALDAVKKAIAKANEAGRYTITLSCGKLTTGVSIPEWTAVLCMKGSEHTPPANYMQTIFRVQTHAVLGGKQKANCYVFDFAPDRALEAVAETSKVQSTLSADKSNRIVKLSDKKEKELLANFIELCPIISMDGGKMDDGRFTADKLFEKLKDVYIEKAVRSGYADNSLYDSKILLNLTPQQEAALNKASEIVGKMKAAWKPDPITVNKQGFTGIEDAEDSQVVYHLQEEQFPIPAKPVASLEAYDNGAPIPKGTEWTEEKPSVDATYKYLYSSHCLKKDGKWGDYSNPVVWQQHKEYSDKPNKTAEQIKRDEENKEKRARMSVLRGVSIRIPLLVYGADINDDKEEITIDNFAGNKADGTPLVDDLSWEEFMPKGFTKKMFNDLKDCFDPDIFTGAGKRIREMVKEADKLDVEERINYIAKIFGYMHNPDKETVLTPWRVVNMQLSKTVGGYTFYDDDFEEFYSEEGDSNVHVRFVDKGKVTQDVFGDYCSRILEINSKTGLYPLYMAYSVFKTCKEKKYREVGLTGERRINADTAAYARQVVNDQQIWEDVLQDNIFVVCRTHMAASITRRTLAGSNKYKMNVKCYEHRVDVDDLISAKVLKPDDDCVKMTQDGKAKHYTYRGNKTKECEMIEVLRARPDYFLRDVVKGNDFWHVYNAIPKNENEDINNMKFKAVVGNPPYQEVVAQKETSNGQKRSSSIFHHFQVAAETIGEYTSLIYPGARWIHRSGKGLEQFGYNQINDVHLAQLEFFPDSTDVFQEVGIADGLSIVTKDKNKTTAGFRYIYTKHGTSIEVPAENPGETLFALNPYDSEIVDHIDIVAQRYAYLHDSVLSQKLFSIESDFVEKNPLLVRTYEEGEYFNPDTEIKLLTNDKAGKAGRARWYVASKDVVQTGREELDKWKVIVSSANAGGQKRSNQIAVVDNHSAFGRSRVALKTFDTKEEAYNFYKYCKSELIRFAFLLTDESLTSLAKKVPDLGNYTNDNGIIDYSQDINEQLYKLFDIDEKNQMHIKEVLKEYAE